METIASLAPMRLAPLPGTEVAAAPSAAATAQFAALMQAPPTEPVSAASALAPVMGPAAPARATGASVGDRIINGMQGISNEVSATWSEVSDTLRPDRAALSMQEMMNLQMRLLQTSMGVELVSKGVTSATQTFDKVVHLQ